MARELAPAGVRSGPRIFAVAAQPSGSKLPRHKRCPLQVFENSSPHLFVMLKEDKHTHAWADCINVACAENKRTNAFRSSGFYVVMSAPAKTTRLFSDRRNR
ncbi:hypothetical protein B1219_29375 [Pseudomonas ogarae]|nr:hypothetical protein B1219_29375 [Pseudomonas ogarae]